MSIGWTEADVQSAEERLRTASDPRPLLNLPNEPKAKVPKPRMNGLETEYAQQLELEKRAGKISWWAFEPFSLRLATGAHYTPDFAVVENGFLSFIETKGHWRESSRVRVKVAAELYPFRFIAITKRRKRDGGGWQVEEFRGST